MALRHVDELSDAIQTIARPLRGDADIEHIADLVGHKRIVLLGEASHGTHEFYDLRAAITRRLVTEHGFSAVCVEGDWPDALRADRFIRGHGDDEDANAALSAFERFPRWMWRNDDVKSLLEWLRAYNLESPERDRVGFYGLDLYSLHTSMRAVVEYLDDNDKESAARARERYSCFDHIAEQDPQHYGLDAHIGIGPKCETEVVAQLVEMQLRKLARSGKSPVGDAWFHAVQQAHVVRNAEAYYRAMFGARSASWNLRDTHMADSLEMIAAHLGHNDTPAKLVVWAHNSHVGDARATEMGDGGQVTLGQLVRERHPGETALIGFTTHEGTVVAAHDWDEHSERSRVRPSLPGSWEEVFHLTDGRRFWMTSPDLQRVAGGEVRLHRAIGVVYRPQTERRSHYLHARLTDEFDLVIHIDTTRGVEPLDPIDSPEQTPEHELPDTYPTGV